MTFAEATALIAEHGNASAAARAIGKSRQYIHAILKRGDRPLKKPGRKPGRRPYVRMKVASAGTLGARQSTGKLPSFGHRMLRDVLDSKKMSPRAIAKALGISEVTIDKLRSGATAFPSLPVAVALEKMLGIRCASWLEAP